MAEYFGMATHSVPFPAWTTIAWQVACFFVFEDTFHVRPSVFLSSERLEEKS